MKAAIKPVAFRRVLNQQFPKKSRLLVLPAVGLAFSKFYSMA
jgi:hypothetical protein